eukprot:scaffold4976_cov131-Isochrysis_galbana.AAC.6
MVAREVVAELARSGVSKHVHVQLQMEQALIDLEPLAERFAPERADSAVVELHRFQCAGARLEVLRDVARADIAERHVPDG